MPTRKRHVGCGGHMRPHHGEHDTYYICRDCGISTNDPSEWKEVKI